MDEGETLTFDAIRNRSGEYWCIADNGLNDTANASAYLDVQCKYDVKVVLKDMEKPGGGGGGSASVCQAQIVWFLLRLI